MSKYIDERPLEQIVRETVLDGKHQDYINSTLSIIQSDEESNWRINTFRGDHTFYDAEIAHLNHKKDLLQSEFNKLNKQYQSVVEKLAELDDAIDGTPQGDEDEEECDEDDGDDYYQEKGKGAMFRVKPSAMKPAEREAKRKRDEVSRQNFKTTLATVQEDLRTLMQEIRIVDSDLGRNRIEQELAIQMLRTLRRIVYHYKENKDIEFLKKGAYFVKDYSDKLRLHYFPATKN